MALDESRDGDEVFEDKGLTYVVEKNLFNQVKPLKVDYISTHMGSGFTISSSLQPANTCGGSCSC